MKKVLAVLFVLTILQLPSMAIITDKEAMSVEYIQNHGHSKEMSRLIDLQNAQINGVKPTFVSTEPEWWTTDKRAYYIRKLFIYLDCGLDDQKFMQHDIKYSNSYEDL